MKVAVTGGRDFDDIECVHRTLNAISILAPITELAHGGATGADTLCARWGARNGARVVPFKANWKIGRRAGPERNTRMLQEFAPDVLVVFPGGVGTADCERKAERMGIAIIRAQVRP